MAGTIGARISDDKLNLLKDFCLQKNLTISDLILQALDKLLNGKIKLKEKLPKIASMCPDCGMHLFYTVTNKEGPHVFCARCGWWAQIELPQGWHKGQFQIIQEV